MPGPEVTEPTLIARAGEFVGGLAVAVAGALGWRKLRNGKSERAERVDYEAMARAFFAEKAREDERHRDALVNAIEELCQVTKSEHAATRQQLREVNEDTRDAIAGLLQTFSNALTAANTKLDILLRDGK